MAENSKIEWTDHTFNPWMGCTKVSPGCEHCYAESLSKRTGRGEYKRGVPRVRTSAANWRKPLKWNKEAAEASCGYCSFDEAEGDLIQQCNRHPRPKVFCASLADWLDDEVLIEWLADLLQLIHDTPNLDWLLLTKRPQNFRARLNQIVNSTIDANHVGVRLAFDWLHGIAPQNVWIGTTVEDQTRADQRIPELLNIPAKVRFLSCEPLLGPVDLEHIEFKNGDDQIGLDARTGEVWMDTSESSSFSNPTGARIDWVIVGGESGHGARPMHPRWAQCLRSQCNATRVQFFFKQWGDWAPINSPEEPVKGQRYFIQPNGKHCTEFFMNGGPSGCHWMERIGKKAAGRLLDGREWNEVPV